MRCTAPQYPSRSHHRCERAPRLTCKRKTPSRKATPDQLVAKMVRAQLRYLDGPLENCPHADFPTHPHPTCPE